MKTLLVELKKSRHRHNALTAVSIALFVLMWAFYSSANIKDEELAQAYSGLLYALPMMNTVVMPLGTAVLASRLWDLESKEKNCRVLLTLQSRGQLFLGKLLAALLQILLIGAVETLGILLLGRNYPQPLDWGQFWWLAATTLAVNAMLSCLWLYLSIRFDNQVPTLAAGMVGSLSGLFAAFLPPVVSYFMPWGYYIPLGTVRMDWNSQTKVVRYYTEAYPVWLLALTVGLMVLFGLLTWKALKDKEV